MLIPALLLILRRSVGIFFPPFSNIMFNAHEHDDTNKCCSVMLVLFLFRSPGLPEIAIDKAENLLEELMEERNRYTRSNSKPCQTSHFEIQPAGSLAFAVSI